MRFSFKQFIVPNFWKRLAFMLPSVIMMGVSLSFLIEVGWGTDPGSFANLNIAHALHISLGNTQVVIYTFLLLFTFFFGKELIGFGTIANMLLIGYTADFCCWLWKKNGLHALIENGAFEIKLFFFILGIVFFVVTASIYMNARMGIAPYDATPKIISSWMPKIPYFVVRMIFDLAVVAIGLVVSNITGEMQGSWLGSLVMSFLLGPAIQFTGKPLEKVLSQGSTD